jgi:hypothetical protein
MSERLATSPTSCATASIPPSWPTRPSRAGTWGCAAPPSEVLERALGCLRDLIDRPFVAARLAAGAPPKVANVDVDAFVT